MEGNIVGLRGLSVHPLLDSLAFETSHILASVPAHMPCSSRGLTHNTKASFAAGLLKKITPSEYITDTSRFLDV